MINIDEIDLNRVFITPIITRCGGTKASLQIETKLNGETIFVILWGKSCREFTDFKEAAVAWNEYEADERS